MPTPDFSWSLPQELDQRVRERLEDCRRREIVRRIWERDPSVWSGSGEDRWLGWLTLPMQHRDALARAARLADDIRGEHVSDVVLLGMGGSSLAPEVVQSIVGRRDGYPSLRVLDATDPSQIAAVERSLDFRRTLFLVASKSGSTLEVNILEQYFFGRVAEELGQSVAGTRFVVTTDPGSHMQEIAEHERFRAIFPGIPSVGGRYSALSHFGLVPTALIGADPVALLDRAEAMARRCESDSPDNAAFELGVLLGELALAGYDKPTLIAPPSVAAFGAWLEQLVAESLGKQGKGIIPIDGESPALPIMYGRDRVFVQLRSVAAPDAASDALAERLERAGHPMVRIEWPDRYALGGEFYRWEFATAVAGAVMGVNPFDQPDVEATKVVTRRLAAEYEKTGALPGDHPLVQEDGLSIFAASAGLPAGAKVSAASSIRALLDGLQDGDYFALLAFIEMNERHRNSLDAIRTLVRDRRKVATTVGFGPRYLHSTGQAHKGGPNSGVFLLITCDDLHDLPVPGQRYSFGTIKLAQARGDFEVLASRGRRLLRVHLEDTESGLSALHALIRDNT
jgi:glucose-6-phosphate isomerase